ncbi:hypothetical protein C9374_012950 [Naegleria lovaniensis]|uniref:Uncharacterized protein n=1 Tax=Naegleria lovaniensis TaxID=51637 RepID=A0AA88G770_NAELO|nr:uncharacterized protein C9374_012950 [Naegleria lovaniensis]KAG2373007.1 hypothetical protein C9374_012950 [Naegleria lovaniensis]
MSNNDETKPVDEDVNLSENFITAHEDVFVNNNHSHEKVNLATVQDQTQPSASGIEEEINFDENETIHARSSSPTLSDDDASSSIVVDDSGDINLDEEVSIIDDDELPNNNHIQNNSAKSSNAQQHGITHPIKTETQEDVDLNEEATSPLHSNTMISVSHMDQHNFVAATLDDEEVDLGEVEEMIETIAPSPLLDTTFSPRSDRETRITNAQQQQHGSSLTQQPSQTFSESIMLDEDINFDEPITIEDEEEINFDSEYSENASQQLKATIRVKEEMVDEDVDLNESQAESSTSLVENTKNETEAKLRSTPSLDFQSDLQREMEEEIDLNDDESLLDSIPPSPHRTDSTTAQQQDADTTLNEDIGLDEPTSNSLPILSTMNETISVDKNQQQQQQEQPPSIPSHPQLIPEEQDRLPPSTSSSQDEEFFQTLNAAPLHTPSTTTHEITIAPTLPPSNDQETPLVNIILPPHQDAHVTQEPSKTIDIISISSDDTSTEGFDHSDESHEEDEEDDLDEGDIMSDDDENYHPTISIRRLATMMKRICSDLCTGSFSSGGQLFCRVGLPGLQIPILTPSSDPISSSLRNQPHPMASQETESYTNDHPTLFKHVSLPIATKEQADELIKLSLSARALPPLRTQDQKKIWYITPNLFKLTNPHWDKMIADVVDDSARRGLGVSSKKKISHELEYLVLYQDGSVDFHRGKKQSTREQVKEENPAFAKLIVQLPSVYSGGAVIVRYHEKEVQYDFSDSSSYLPSYISLYDECDREECSIQSGYRLCLVYKIIFTGGEGRIPKFDHGSQISHDLKRLVDEWSEQEPPMAVFPLANVYPQSSFNFESLKDDDALIFNFFNNFNANHPQLHLFLAVFEKKAVVSRSTRSDETQNISYRAFSLLGPNNDTRFQKFSLNLDVSSIFPYDAVTDMPFTERNQLGSGPVELKCRCTCLIIIPKKIDYMFWAYTDPTSCYQGFLSLYNQYRSDPTRRDACIRLALSQKDSAMFKSNISELVPILIDLKDTNLLKLFITSAAANISLNTWNVILSQFSIDDLKQEFLTSVVRSTCANANNLCQRLQASIEMVQKFNNSQLSQEFITKIIESLSINTSSQYMSLKAIGILLNTLNSLELPITPAFKKLLVKRTDIYTFSDKPTGIITSIFRTCLQQNERPICDTIFNNMIQSVTPLALEASLDTFVTIIHMIGLESSISRVQNVLRSVNSITLYLNMMRKLQTNFLENNSEYHKEASFIFKECKHHVINSFYTMQTLDITLCQQVLVFFWTNKLLDDITGITSTIIVKAGTDYEVLLTLIRYIEQKFGQAAFQHIAFNSILLNCSNIVKVHLSQASASSGQDWSFNVDMSCHCAYCQPAQLFLKDKTQRQIELRHAEKYRNHISEQVKQAVADNAKYLKFETIKTGSPYGLLIKKIATPNDSQKRKVKRIQDIDNYLTRLIASVNNASSSSSQVPGYIVASNSPTASMSSSQSNTSISSSASTSSSSGVKRIISHSSSSSLNPPNKKSKER